MAVRSTGSNVMLPPLIGTSSAVPKLPSAPAVMSDQPDCRLDRLTTESNTALKAETEPRASVSLCAGEVATNRGGVRSGKRLSMTSEDHAVLPPVSVALARRTKLDFVAVSAGARNVTAKGNLPLRAADAPSM